MEGKSGGLGPIDRGSIILLTPEIVGIAYESTTREALGVWRQDNLDRGRLRPGAEPGYANLELSHHGRCRARKGVGPLGGLRYVPSHTKVCS